MPACDPASDALPPSRSTSTARRPRRRTANFSGLTRRNPHRLPGAAQPGRLICLGPNIRFLPDVYWDFWDHYLALSDRTLTEGLSLTGYEVVCVTVMPRWVQFSTDGMNRFTVSVVPL